MIRAPAKSGPRWQSALFIPFPSFQVDWHLAALDAKSYLSSGGTDVS